MDGFQTISGLANNGQTFGLEQAAEPASIGRPASSATFGKDAGVSLDDPADAFRTSLRSATISMHSGTISARSVSIGTRSVSITSHSARISTQSVTISTRSGKISTQAGTISGESATISTRVATISTRSGTISTCSATFSIRSATISTGWQPIHRGCYPESAGLHRPVRAHRQSRLRSGKTRTSCSLAANPAGVIIGRSSGKVPASICRINDSKGFQSRSPSLCHVPRRRWSAVS